MFADIFRASGNNAIAEGGNERWDRERISKYLQHISEGTQGQVFVPSVGGISIQSGESGAWDLIKLPRAGRSYMALTERAMKEDVPPIGNGQVLVDMGDITADNGVVVRAETLHAAKDL